MAKQVTILLIVCLVALGGGFLGGYKYRGKANDIPVSNTSKIDSLQDIQYALEDSIRTLSTEQKEAVKIRIKYQTIYDTIRVKDDLADVLEGLRRIAKTPPE